MEEEQRKRGRPRKTPNLEKPHIQIDFSQVVKLGNLDIDPKILGQMESGLILDKLISREGGMPYASNIMCIGDPGVGKTTLLLDYISTIQLQNKNNNKDCLFISGEMSRKQMFKYTKRFPQFGVVKTLFFEDYMDFNMKDVIEQLLEIGWDLILIDSIAEVIDAVREDMNWDRKTAESWLVGVCVKNNKGLNKNNKFSSFLLIQQVTKGGVFVGSNKLKHLMGASMEMRKAPKKEGGGTYIEFTKNRDGEVGNKLYYQLTGTQIIYTNLEVVDETEDEEKDNKNFDISIKEIRNR